MRKKRKWTNIFTAIGAAIFAAAHLAGNPITEFEFYWLAFSAFYYSVDPFVQGWL